MAYAAGTSQPVCLVQGVGGGSIGSDGDTAGTAAQAIGRGGALWYYASADVDSDVDAADYFTNGSALGLKVGDVMFVFDSAGVMTLMYVSAVTAGGAATVAAATVTV